MLGTVRKTELCHLLVLGARTIMHVSGVECTSSLSSLLIAFGALFKKLQKKLNTAYLNTKKTSKVKWSL